MKTLMVDPNGCRCTDCLVGDSVPVDWLTERQKDQMSRNDFTDRTGYTERDWEAVLNPPRAMHYWKKYSILNRN